MDPRTSNGAFRPSAIKAHAHTSRLRGSTAHDRGPRPKYRRRSLPSPKPACRPRPPPPFLPSSTPLFLGQFPGPYFPLFPLCIPIRQEVEVPNHRPSTRRSRRPNKREGKQEKKEPKLKKDHRVQVKKETATPSPRLKTSSLFRFFPTFIFSASSPLAFSLVPLAPYPPVRSFPCPLTPKAGSVLPSTATTTHTPPLSPATPPSFS